MAYGEGMTPADVAAVTNHNGGNSGMWGGDFGSWIILFLIFALFGGGARGFGGFGGYGGGCGEACATQSDVRAAVDQQTLINKLDQQTYGLADSTYALRGALSDGFNGVERGFCDISHQISDCCCNTRQAIADVKYTIAQEGCETRHAISNNTRDIIDNANANSRAVLDFLVQGKLESKNERISQLENQLAISNQTAAFRAALDASTAEIIRRTGNECPIPSYQVPNPHCCYGNPVGVSYGGGGCGGYSA